MTALLTADEAARLRPGERLVIVRAGDREPKTHLHGIKTWDRRVAPQAWAALTGPCPICRGKGHALYQTCEHCRHGRRIEPLYTECPNIAWHKSVVGTCLKCENNSARVLVGRGSIEVVPEDDGRNWRILIDCVEVNT